jgi:hypothetical protein
MGEHGQAAALRMIAEGIGRGLKQSDFAALAKGDRTQRKDCAVSPFWHNGVPAMARDRFHMVTSVNVLHACRRRVH